MALTAFLNRPRVAPALLAIACLSALGTALASQYWGGLQPCVLCLYQRYAYGVALAFAGLAFLAAAHALGRRILLMLAGLAFAAGSAIAAFHVGVEQKWWEGTAQCHAPQFPAGATVEQMREILLNQSFAPCDVVSWELLGLSMAGFNVLASAALAALSLWAAFRTGTHS
ncbi:MAG TPA: disulfide bond formation protein B [Kiloniellaceae bacterium]